MPATERVRFPREAERQKARCCVSLVVELPKTATGKIQRFLLWEDAP
ncbi:MAG: hypothetical protein ACRD3M_12365 [Thermoanaerobaculia bacterium]